MKHAITDEQLLTKELDHKHAGNGFVMCEILDDVHIRVTGIGHNSTFGTRAFVAARDRLVVYQDKDIPESFIEPLALLRQQLKSGELKSVLTHIVKGKASR